MSDTQNDWTLRCEEQWKGGRFFRTECRDDALCLKEDAFAGTVCLPPLDSGESAFRWTRLRLTADGHLKPCLHSADEISIRGLPEEEVRERFRRAILAKPACHGALSARDRSPAARAMNRIGG